MFDVSCILCDMALLLNVLSQATARMNARVTPKLVTKKMSARCRRAFVDRSSSSLSPHVVVMAPVSCWAMSSSPCAAPALKQVEWLCQNRNQKNTLINGAKIMWLKCSLMFDTLQKYFFDLP